ncbi:MAG: ATP-binding protein [Chloroflexota bacterium]
MKVHTGFDRIWRVLGSVSLRTKIFGIVLGSTLILSLVFLAQVRNALGDVLIEKSREEGISVARDVAARATDLILINDVYSLHKLLLETQRNYTDVRYAFILDTQNHVLAHTFGEGFPLELITVNAAAPDTYQNTVVLDVGNEVVWDVAVPIFDGRAGTARVGISSNSVTNTLREISLQLVITLTVVLAGSLLAATVLTLVLTKPILTLVDATEKISRGDYSTRVERWADDEIGDLAISFNHMASGLAKLDAVRSEREQLRRQLLEGVIAAQEEERRRIARELHDSTSQSLTSLKLGLQNVAHVCQGLEVEAQLEQLRCEAGHILDDVHALAVQLRPTVLDDLGLKAAVERLVKEWGKRHQTLADGFVHLRDERLSGGVETAIYRIVQEALANVAKHARADSVSVLVEQRAGDVITIIEDDGIGFDVTKGVDQGRLGLLSMKERAELLGGSLTIESRPDKGTSVFVTIPAIRERELADDG